MKVILSCTTTWERINFFYYCLQSMFRQAYTPDIILVNISKYPYLKDSGFSNLPEWLKDDRVTINWVENTGPYRKLIPAVRFAEANDLIVTADDDILYHKDWLHELVNLSKKAPDCIICARARKMERNIFGRWKNYSKWTLLKKQKKGKRILPTNGAGSVYRKELLDLNFLMDKKFMRIAPTTDDLWFKIASAKKGISVLVEPEIDKKNIYLKHEQGIVEINQRSKNSNSILIREIEKVYRKSVDHLGINRTINDYAWDKINNYVKASGFND